MGNAGFIPYGRQDISEADIAAVVAVVSVAVGAGSMPRPSR